MLERQKPFEPVEMVFHEEMDLRDPIATGKHGQQAHGNDFGQIVHRSVSGPRILDGFKYHQHAVHLGHHCSSLVTMHLERLASGRGQSAVRALPISRIPWMEMSRTSPCARRSESLGDRENRSGSPAIARPTYSVAARVAAASCQDSDPR